MEAMGIEMACPYIELPEKEMRTTHNYQPIGTITGGWRVHQ